MITSTTILTSIIAFTVLFLALTAVKTKMSMVNFLTISAVILFAMILTALFGSDYFGITIKDNYRDLLNIMIGAFLTYFNLIIRHHVRGSDESRNPDMRTRKNDKPPTNDKPTKPVENSDEDEE